MKTALAYKQEENLPMSKYTLRDLDQARLKLRAARNMFDSNPVGSRAWKRAAEELEFWGSKVAFLENVRG